MFNPNPITNEKPDSLQQSFGTLLLPVNLIHGQDDKKNAALEEIETDPKNEDDDLNRYISECQKRMYKRCEFPKLVESVNSDEQFKRYYGLIGIRKLLGRDPIDENQIQKVIDAGLSSKLVEFMNTDDELQLQLEATWSLVGITYGTSDQVKQIIDQGAVPILVKLLKSCHTELVLNAVLVIANIACEPRDRDLLLDHEALHPLIDVLNQALDKKDNTLIESGTRALTYLLRGKPLVEYEKVADAIPVVCRVIKEVSDVEVLQNALWGINFLSYKLEKISRVLECDVIPSLIRCLDSSDDLSVIPALRTLGYIAESDQAEAVLKALSTRSYMKKLFQLLKTRSDEVRREVCTSLSYIAYKKDFVHLIFSKSEYVGQLISVAIQDVFEVKKEAIWTLVNATKNGNQNQLMSMVRNGGFDCLCKFIQQDPPEDSMVLLGLTGIQNLLTVTTQMSRKQAINNKCLIKLKEKKTVNRIEKSKESQDEKLSQLAVEILNKYLKEHYLKRKLKLKRSVIYFRNEKHVLFGLFQNKKKKLSV